MVYALMGVVFVLLVICGLVVLDQWVGDDEFPDEV